MENAKCGNTKLGVYCIHPAAYLSERKFRYLTRYKLHSPLHSNIKIKKLYIYPFFMIMSSIYYGYNTIPATLKVHGQELCNMIISQNKEIMSTDYL
jgi:hypothetical protein